MSNAMPSRRKLADHPLVQLTLVRFREFMREPEAVFWVFIFPILLAAGLGHRLSQPAGGSTENRGGDAASWRQSLRQEKLLDVQQIAARRGGDGAAHGQGGAAGRAGRRTARWCIATTTPIPKGGTARMLADRAIQTRGGAHRSGGGERRVHARAGFALYRFPDSRTARDEPDGQRDLGHGIRDCGCAPQEADEAPGRDADAASITICCRSCLSRLSMLVVEVGCAAGLRRAGVSGSDARIAARSWPRCACWRRWRSARWGC